MKKLKHDFPIQGDIAFVPVKIDKRKLKHRIDYSGSVIVGHGEVTGHMHRVQGNCALLSDTQFTEETVDKFARTGEGPNLYLVVNNPGVKCLHEEHGPVAFKEGETYKITRQREYEDGDWAYVAD